MYSDIYSVIKNFNFSKDKHSYNLYELFCNGYQFTIITYVDLTNTQKYSLKVYKIITDKKFPRIQIENIENINYNNTLNIIYYLNKYCYKYFRKLKIIKLDNN